ncbi:MAG: anaerobic ribonucleoside triphosphate reductase [Culicoidibacterales bacterium]
MMITILKRDGLRQPFNKNKIHCALAKAFEASGISPRNDDVKLLTLSVCKQIVGPTVAVEEVQDIVEAVLMQNNPQVAKKYILYRHWRTTQRDTKTMMKQVMDGIVAVEANDVNNENANMSAHTPAGQMMTFASEVTKDYTYKYLLHENHALLHQNGDIHIHDLDYYPTKTTTCLQYDLADLFTRGFTTKNGSIRTPQSIQSYATLATIIFQTNQNEQHGGQAIPAFDYFMAPGVLKTFCKIVSEDLCFLADALKLPLARKSLKTTIKQYIPSIALSQQQILLLTKQFAFSPTQISLILKKAETKTQNLTYQAMEGFIHNLNTMHSRGGNQVVFSSINYGTDTSPEGRMVISELLRATVAGLGHGQTPIFPIQIFKVKAGISYSDADMRAALADFKEACAGNLAFTAPNFDLLLAAISTTATSLFPNFVFLDAPFNQNPLWQKNDPQRYRYEVATMGCRTRVFENLHGEKSSLGRGNLSFTTLNLPRLAIVAKQEALTALPTGTIKAVEALSVSLFLTKVGALGRVVAKQLYLRLLYQKSALAKQFPFMMSNDVFKGGMALKADDTIADVLNSGTLGIGFIGGHNAMVALHGLGHGVSLAAHNTLYQTLTLLNEVANEFKDKYKLNYAVLATPAEGLSGRFTKLDAKLFGLIPGVNDRGYYVNSFHIDVKEPISSFAKIKKEAPFHALTLGGHITYVELDGEAKQNTVVLAKLVKHMYDEGIGYGSINHPVDTCKSCGYKGVIYAKCPLCESEAIMRIRRITGYLTGSLDTWNSSKRLEESDRVKHGV